MMLFLFLGMLGFLGGNLFSTDFLKLGTNFSVLKDISLPLFNIAICLLVSSGIYTIFITLIRLRVRKGQEK